MKIKAENIKEWMEYLELAEGFKPVIKDTIEKLLTFTPEIKPIFQNICGGIADLRIEMVKKFEDAGFTREEAIYMTMDEWWGFRRIANNKTSKK